MKRSKIADKTAVQAVLAEVWRWIFGGIGKKRRIVIRLWVFGLMFISFRFLLF